MAGRRKAKRMAPGIITGVEGYSFQEVRTELVHGGQRPVGEMVYRSSKALPQDGQSKVSFGKIGEDGENSSERGE